MYCLVDGLKDMVFVSNKESCADQKFYTHAVNFKDFMCLILDCWSANPVEQIIWMDGKQFDQHFTGRKEKLD